MSVLIKEEVGLEVLSRKNLNMLWGAGIAGVLARAGVRDAVIAPGSRSAPLALGFAASETIKSTPVVDERSAAFYALGMAKRSKRPAALVCTSGTAAAHFYPAVIEARLTKVPLIVLTADRPPEIRDCHDRQTIDQLKIFGSYPVYFHDIGLPRKDVRHFKYLRETLKHAYSCALNCEGGGPVHLNVAFDDTLAPVEDPQIGEFLGQMEFDNWMNEVVEIKRSGVCVEEDAFEEFVKEFKQTQRGVILVGTDDINHGPAYVDGIAKLAKATGWPVFADAMSPVRHACGQVCHVIAHYDVIVRNDEIARDLEPEVVISIGIMPTTKVGRAWLEKVSPKLWLIEDSVHNMDPLRLSARYVRGSIEEVGDKVESIDSEGNPFTQRWVDLEKQVDRQMKAQFADIENLFEGKIPAILAQVCPDEMGFFVSNSMPIRDMEFFFPGNDKRFQTYSARGANGIDGILSTAFGLAAKRHPTILVTGDLAFLHDTNGLLLNTSFEGSLTVLLINNDGGRIFENLPIAQFESFNEEYMTTPQIVNFSKICEAHGVGYECVKSWEHLEALMGNKFQGVRVVEMKTDSKVDVPFRKNLIRKIQEQLK